MSILVFLCCAFLIKSAHRCSLELEKLWAFLLGKTKFEFSHSGGSPVFSGDGISHSLAIKSEWRLKASITRMWSMPQTMKLCDDWESLAEILQKKIWENIPVIFHRENMM